MFAHYEEIALFILAHHYIIPNYASWNIQYFDVISHVYCSIIVTQGRARKIAAFETDCVCTLSRVDLALAP